MHMPSILKSDYHLRLLNSQGYTRFPLLSAESCQTLLDLYQSDPYTEKGTGLGFYTALDQQNSTQSLEKGEQMMRSLSPSLSRYLQDFQAITSTFIVKDHGSDNISPIHQDWTFVEEPHYASYMLWCPLQDVDLENGTLGLLPGTHRLLGHTARPSPSPPYESILKDVGMELFKYMDFLSLSAGDALLFDHRLLHGAMPNFSPNPRIAIGVGLTHKDAQLQHHYLIPNSQEVAVLAVDQLFFYIYSNEALATLYQQSRWPEKYNCLRRYDFQLPEISADQLLEEVKKTQSQHSQLTDLLPSFFSTNTPSSSVNEEETEEPTTSSTDTFWKLYTPRNILLEIQHRLSKYLSIDRKTKALPEPSEQPSHKKKHSSLPSS